MTVEDQTEKKEEVVEEEKTTEELSEKMYPNDVKEKESEAKDGDETETPKEEPAEKEGEQEETKDREVPEEYKLTLSKDSPLDDKSVEDVIAYAKEHDLSKEQAQSQLEREETLATSFAKTQQDNLDASVAEWTTTIENHPVYGGEKLDAATKVANRPLIKYGSEELNTFLKDSGLSNHPAAFDLFHKLGSAMGDDGFVKGSPPPTDKPKSMADRWYPDQAKKE